MNNLIKLLDKKIIYEPKYIKMILSTLELDFIKFIKINKNKYSRNILYRNDLYEVIVITWLSGQYTKLHGHPENGCLMKVLYGELNEIIFDNKNNIKERTIKKNNITFINDNLGKHIISNLSNSPSITLHIYSPPNYYDK